MLLACIDDVPPTRPSSQVKSISVPGHTIKPDTSPVDSGSFTPDTHAQPSACRQRSPTRSRKSAKHEAIAWAQQPQGVNPINWVHRLVAVRGFAFNLEVDLLFFDTTSTYFERDEEEDGDDAFRRFGHSKDHRPDLPQIVIGLAVTKEGIPVR